MGRRPWPCEFSRRGPSGCCRRRGICPAEPCTSSRPDPTSRPPSLSARGISWSAPGKLSFLANSDLFSANSICSYLRRNICRRSEFLFNQVIIWVVKHDAVHYSAQTQFIRLSVENELLRLQISNDYADLVAERQNFYYLN